MIYELMKRDFGWKAVPWFVPSMAVLCACPSPVCIYGALAVVGCLIMTTPMARATRLYASLPIAGRDVFLARVLSIMAVVWLPALAGAGAAALFRRPYPATVGPFIVAALCTLAAGLAQSIHPRRLAGPKWTLAPLWLLAAEGGLYLMFFRPSALIAASCALAGIALLARTWLAVPKSFELAPTKPGAGDGPVRQTAVSSPRLVWLPVLRSVFSRPYSTVLLFTLWMALPLMPLFSCFPIIVMWQAARMNTLWIRPLPIRRRALLLTIVAPILLALALGFFTGFHVGRHPRPVPTLQIEVLDLGALLGCALAFVLVNALLDWRRLSPISRRVRIIVFCAFMAVPCLGGMVGTILLHGDPLHKAVPRLAQALPNSVALAMTLVAAALGALWWAIEKVFAETDSATKPRPQKDEYQM